MKREQKYKVVFKNREFDSITIDKKQYNALLQIIDKATHVRINDNLYATSGIDRVIEADREKYIGIEEHTGPVVTPERAREIREQYRQRQMNRS